MERDYSGELLRFIQEHPSVYHVIDPWGPGPLSVSRHGARKRPAGGRKSARKGKRNRICPRCAWT